MNTLYIRLVIVEGSRFYINVVYGIFLNLGAEGSLRFSEMLHISEALQRR